MMIQMMSLILAILAPFVLADGLVYYNTSQVMPWGAPCNASFSCHATYGCNAGVCSTPRKQTVPLYPAQTTLYVITTSQGVQVNLWGCAAQSDCTTYANTPANGWNTHCVLPGDNLYPWWGHICIDDVQWDPFTPQTSVAQASTPEASMPLPSAVSLIFVAFILGVVVSYLTYKCRKPTHDKPQAQLLEQSARSASGTLEDQSHRATEDPAATQSLV